MVISYYTGCDRVMKHVVIILLWVNNMCRMGAQVHGFGANKPTCTPLHGDTTVIKRAYSNFMTCCPLKSEKYIKREA